eukprot:GHVO01000754.1.p1 GENE.GHVO01000754.1~~GHVO01000754.1.p1  ORF type:complete len:194 (+),score=23.99 GHVO01000754.1:28-609(+)
MSGLSLLRSASVGSKMLQTPLSRIVLTPAATKTLLQASVRQMGGHGRTMQKYPSRFDFTLLKDHLHFYILLGVIPLGLYTTYINLTHGKPEVKEIPDGYEPEYWEYYRHPISQKLAKWFHYSPEQIYEMKMHHIKIAQDSAKMALLQRKVTSLMSQRGDYKAWYYMPINERRVWKAHEKEEEVFGRHNTGKFT